MDLRNRSVAWNPAKQVWFIPCVALLLGFLLAPQSAWAAAVQGIAVSPNPAKTGQTTTIKVNGNGICAKVEITFGDGQQEDKTNVDFEGGKILNVPHTYNTAGTVEVKARGRDGCMNTKKMNLVVQQGSGGGSPSSPGKLGIKREVIGQIGPVKPKPGIKKPGNMQPGAAQSGPLKASPSIGKMAQMPFIVGAKVQPHGDYASFQVTSSRPAVLKLRLFNSFVTSANFCNESYPVFKATFALGMKKNWSTQLMGLNPNTNYLWEVCAKDEDGNTTRADGTFKNMNRKVEITFGKITVTDDSDDLSAGDLWFIMEAGGQRVEHRADVDTGGSTTPNKTITLINPPESFALCIRGADDDSSDVGGPAFSTTEIPNSVYEDWGDIQKSVMVGYGGLAGEEISNYNWTAAHHGLGFKASVKVKTSFTP